MKTNSFLDKYINLQAALKKDKKELSEMGWKSKCRDICIRPHHFNYFYLSISIGDEEMGIPIDEAREMANYILRVTEGLEDTNEIINEIIKRKKF